MTGRAREFRIVVARLPERDRIHHSLSIEVLMENPRSALAVQIDAQLRQLLGDERNTEVNFILRLDQFDRAEGYVAFGYASLWQYLQRGLGLLEYALYRRTAALKLLRRFPKIESILREGRIEMCALVKLGEILTPANFDEMVAKASGKSYREVKTFVASFRPPAPQKQPVIRRVPMPPPVPEPVQTPPTESERPMRTDESSPSRDLPPDGRVASGLDTNPGNDESEGRFSSQNPVPPRPPRVEPVSANQFDVSLRVPAEFVDDAEEDLQPHDPGREHRGGADESHEA